MHGDCPAIFRCLLLGGLALLSFVGTNSPAAQTGGYASPFLNWASNCGLDGSPGREAGATEDPDHDGYMNLEEFAFGGDPLNPSDHGKRFGFLADSWDPDNEKELVLTIAMRKNAPPFTGYPSVTSRVDGLTYTARGATSLATFNVGVTPVAPLTQGQPAPGADYEYRSFSLNGSASLLKQGFLQATVAPDPLWVAPPVYAVYSAAKAVPNANPGWAFPNSPPLNWPSNVVAELTNFSISTFRVSRPGSYQLGMAWVENLQTVQTGLVVKVLLNGVVVSSKEVPPASLTRFEARLENLLGTDEIGVAVGAKSYAAAGTYNMDYRVALVDPQFGGARSFHVALYGAVGNGITDDLVAISNTIAAASAAGGGIINFDGTKTYRIVGNPAVICNAFDLNSKSNLWFRGNGARLLLHPPARLFDMLGCENIEVSNFVLDYDPLPYWQANVVAVNVSLLTIDVQVPERYPIPDITGSWPVSEQFFGRIFVPESPGSRAGTGKHLYFDSVTALDGTGRLLRIKAATNMVNEVKFAQGTDAEVIMPNRLYGQKGNYTMRIRLCSRIRVRDVLFYCAPHFVNQVQDCTGPITLSNVNVLLKNPATEQFISWRDGFHWKENRFGVLLENSLWDASCMYDDLFNMSSHMGSVQQIPGSNTCNITLGGYDYHTWRTGDWVTVWSPGQAALRGRARVLSPAATVGTTFNITLDRSVPGLAINDLLVNEEQLNRGTLVRSCAATPVGGHGATARLRTPALFADCNFTNSYWWLYTAPTEEGPAPKDITFLKCYLQGRAPWGLFVINQARSARIENCVLDGNNWVKCQNSANILLNGVHWINQSVRAVDLVSSGPVYLYGGSTINGIATNLGSWVRKDTNSTIYYSAP